jgi:hypothetical protein
MVHGSTLSKSEMNVELRKSFPNVRRSDIVKLMTKCVNKEISTMEEAPPLKPESPEKPEANKIKDVESKTKKQLLVVDPHKISSHFLGEMESQLSNAKFKEQLSSQLPRFGGDNESRKSLPANETIVQYSRIVSAHPPSVADVGKAEGLDDIIGEAVTQWELKERDSENREVSFGERGSFGKDKTDAKNS